MRVVTDLPDEGRRNSITKATVNGLHARLEDQNKLRNAFP